MEVVEGGEFGGPNRMRRHDFDRIENNSSLNTFARARMNKSVAFEETEDLRRVLPDITSETVNIDTSIITSEFKTDLNQSNAVGINEPQSRQRSLRSGLMRLKNKNYHSVSMAQGDLKAI
jgi:hypothetical protein